MKLVVDVKVSDLRRAVGFYTKTLGLTCRVETKEWAGITVGSAEIHLYTDGGDTEGVEFYVDDIEAEVRRLAARGVVVTPGIGKPGFLRIDVNGISEFPWGRLAYFNDSEGNELALVKDA